MKTSRSKNCELSSLAPFLLLAISILLFTAPPVKAQVGSHLLVVNTTTDESDSNLADMRCKTAKGKCTLRAAIEQANAKTNPPFSPDVILFEMVGGGPFTIDLKSPLPDITDRLIIQGGLITGGNILDGSALGGPETDGLVIRADSCEINGLIIVRFSGSGIKVLSNENKIQGNYIGTNAFNSPGLGNAIGVYVTGNNNLIGGRNFFATLNRISSNLEYGVLVGGSGNQVVGNYIGDAINSVGPPVLGNGTGVRVSGTNNIIGGTSPATRNIISGNHGSGVETSGKKNAVKGNYIGTTVGGGSAIGNGRGIMMGSDGDTIGGREPGAGNVISGNRGNGITMFFADSSVVQGNYIGTTASGTAGLGNRGFGILAGFSEIRNNFTVIGGTDSLARNLISGNGASGIYLFVGTRLTSVRGNYIGTDVTGAIAIPNNGHGIWLAGDFDNNNSFNTIGGTAPGAGNLISGNGGNGILISEENNGNRILGNFIGTDAAGSSAIPNGLAGVLITSGASNDTIGGINSSARNLISGNGGDGIRIEGTGTIRNLVQGNLIGADASGTKALPNAFQGVIIADGASNNTIGGRGAGTGNTIAFNSLSGVIVAADTSIRNAILSNSIFSNRGLGIDLGTDGNTPNDGKDIDGGPNNLQNFPNVLEAGISKVGNLVFKYNVDSDSVNSAYPLTIQFFASDNGGEGKRLLGEDIFTANDFKSGTKIANLGKADSLQIAMGASIVATATDSLGNTSEFSPIRIVGMTTAVAESKSNLPSVFALHQNYPNPFNPGTLIKYQLPQAGKVVMKVYNSLGQEVRTLVNEVQQPGSYRISWNGRNERGDVVPSGIYFYRLEAGSFVQIRKMTLLR